MPDLRRVAIAAAVAVTIVLAAAGCGVSTSGPVDLGDGLVAGADARNAAAVPPLPNDASSDVDLVERYLKAGVESGPGQPLDRVQSFLTLKGKAALGVDPKNPPDPVVIRIVGGPTSSPGDTSSGTVRVDYVLLGQLTDQGRIDNLSPDTTVKTMTFHVTPAVDNASKLRIDAIANAPAGIVISDDAVGEFYRTQPVYFWDAGNTTLVPDIRYVPVSLAADARAGRIVQWLVDGPSGWIAAGRLPTGVAVKPSVQIRDGSVIVNLTAQTAAVGEPAIERLYHQLQMSLQDGLGTAMVKLEIDDKPQEIKGSPTDYRHFDASYSLPARGMRYDIVDGKVAPATTGGALPAVLAAKENQNVLFAALNRTATMAAYVKASTDGRNRSLVIVRDGAATVTVSFLAKSADVGRPVWATSDTLLIPYGGLLYSVSSDGHARDVTPPHVGEVQAVSMAPDGRRIALVADGQAYVTWLSPGDGLSVGATPRAILTGEVTAVAVAWISEAELYVAGKSATIWRVTADGVIAINLSKTLGGVTPTDVVAFPTAPFQAPAEAYLYAGAAIYPLISGLSQLTLDPRLKAPFFGG
jgi:hypothetical protein